MVTGATTQRSVLLIPKRRRSPAWEWSLSDNQNNGLVLYQYRTMYVMLDGPYFVYIMTNSVNSVLYTGQTHNLLRRVWEHKGDLVNGFTKTYHINKLVYYEIADDQAGALYREKQLKKYSRQKKRWLIESMHPSWRDLYPGLNSEKL
jgi:putative endonuclease